MRQLWYKCKDLFNVFTKRDNMKVEDYNEAMAFIHRVNWMAWVWLHIC